MAQKKKSKSQEKKGMSKRQLRRMRIGQFIAISFAVLVILSMVIGTMAPLF